MDFLTKIVYNSFLQVHECMSNQLKHWAVEAGTHLDKLYTVCAFSKHWTQLGYFRGAAVTNDCHKHGNEHCKPNRHVSSSHVSENTIGIYTNPLMPTSGYFEEVFTYIPLTFNLL